MSLGTRKVQVTWLIKHGIQHKQPTRQDSHSSVVVHLHYPSVLCGLSLCQFIVDGQVTFLWWRGHRDRERDRNVCLIVCRLACVTLLFFYWPGQGPSTTSWRQRQQDSYVILYLQPKVVQHLPNIKVVVEEHIASYLLVRPKCVL